NYGTDIATGGYDLDTDKPDGVPKISKLIPNKTVILSRVAPNLEESSQEYEAPTLAALVGAVNPSEEYDITVTRGVMDTSSGEQTTETLPCKMAYGEDDPNLVMDDFTDEALVAKITSGEGSD